MISSFKCRSRPKTRPQTTILRRPPSRTSFEDYDGGVCYLETHDTDRFAGHFRLRLISFTPTHLSFEIDRPEDRTVEVTYKLSTRRFHEVQRIVHIIFGVER